MSAVEHGVVGADASMRPDVDLRTLSGAVRRYFRQRCIQFLLLQCIVAAAIRGWCTSDATTDGLVVLGVLVYWPLQEWFFHWTVLHMKPFHLGPFFIDPYFPKQHRLHHRQPEDLNTTFLPLRFVLTVAPFHVLLWWLITPSIGAACTGIAFFTLATLIYEWVHFLTHTPYRPRGRYYRWIRRNHQMHHFRNENYWFSFTAPFLDTVFGTGPNPADVPRSSSCRTLGVDENRAKVNRSSHSADGLGRPRDVRDGKENRTEK